MNVRFASTIPNRSLFLSTIELAWLGLFAGCQQPVTNPQAGSGSWFKNIFTRTANNNLQNNILNRFAQNAFRGNNGQSGGGGILGGGFPSLAGNNAPRSSWQNSGFNNGTGMRGGYRGTGQGSLNGGPGNFGGANGSFGVNPQQIASMANELQGMNQRITAYDSDNQLLNTEIASLRQKLQLSDQYNSTLKQQLADTTGRIQQAEVQRQAALQQLAAAQQQISRFANSGNKNGFGGSGANNNATPGQLVGFDRGQSSGQSGLNGGNAGRFAGPATLRANNSLMQRFASIRIPGGQARMDGDVIRIEFPTDRLFVPGTYQIQPGQQPLLQNLTATIRQTFPRQIVGVEAHWDNTPLNPPTTTHHQLTATQALAVFDELVRLGLPRTQMFTMAMASNRPRYPQRNSGGISPNRRIELVIYPETFDGS